MHIIDHVGIGGAQKSVTMLARVIHEYDSKLIVLSLYKSQSISFHDELESDGAEIHYFPGTKLLGIRRIVSIIKFLRVERVDIVHTHLVYGNIIGIIAARLAGVPVMAMCHSSGIDPKLYHPIRHWLETWLLRFAANMVTGDSHSAAAAQRPRLKTKPIYAVPNAVSEVPPIPDSTIEAIREKFTAGDDCTLIITVGRLSAPKGYSDLITAFNIVSKLHPKTRLVIVGKGDLYDELAEQIELLGVSESVILTGPRGDVPALLAASDLFVSSSHWEGLSLALLEAMMSGLPIVATKVGDALRVVPENVGIIVPPKEPKKLAEALLTFIEDPKKRKIYGQNAHENATQNLGPKPWAELLFSLYEQVLSETNSKSVISAVSA
ncbi:MAG: glycosyltransferase [Anaerolineales bacterium]|nr:glycosyltransferase [Anaerolineales bacterium]